MPIEIRWEENRMFLFSYLVSSSVFNFPQSLKLNMVFAKRKNSITIKFEFKFTLRFIHRTHNCNRSSQKCRKSRSHGKKAMKNEMQSLNCNDTWKFMPLPKDRKAIKSKWVFKVKIDANGQISTYKARLVAIGFSQRPGIDFDETFAPVVRYDSIRYLLALAVPNGYTIDQMDAITAFLQGDLSECVYMEQAEYFADGTDCVCKLKEAGRMWNIKLDGAVKNYGLRKSITDPYIYYDSDLNIIIAIYKFRAIVNLSLTSKNHIYIFVISFLVFRIQILIHCAEFSFAVVVVFHLLISGSCAMATIPVQNLFVCQRMSIANERIERSKCS